MKPASWLVPVLVLASMAPEGVAAQSHGLAPNDRVWVQYVSFGSSHTVEGKVGSVTPDSVTVRREGVPTKAIAWSQVQYASRWRADPPKRYTIGLVGALAGAVFGGFGSTSNTQNQGGSATQSAFVRGGALGFIAGALLGVGVSYVWRTHSWHPIDVRPQVSEGARSRPAFGMTFTVRTGRR